MATNLDIDDNLIVKALKLGGHSTKKSAVTQALLEYVQHLEQQKITDLFGRVEYHTDHDFKKQRARA